MFGPQTIQIDPGLDDLPQVKAALAYQEKIPKQDFTTHSDFSLKQVKRRLHLTNEPGEWVKPCPGTSVPYLCCGYWTINTIRQCPMDCSYCVLQAYLDVPAIQVHPSTDDVFEGIERVMKEQPSRLFRFGTGELGDSLALDGIVPLAELYLDFFRNRRNALVEFKTKSVEIDAFLSNSHPHAVVAWSVNPQSIITSEEKGAASLSARVTSAKRCQDAGFMIGLHFDPLVLVPEWERLCLEVVDQIFSALNPKRIAWISLGALRFPPGLLPVIRKRFPESRIADREMIRGMDGKLRYPRLVRTELFRLVWDAIRRRSPDVFIYFCMEHPEIWRQVAGSAPTSNEELDFMFAESLRKRFPEIEMDEPVKTVYGSW